MKRILTLILALLPLVASATTGVPPKTKGWSLYGDLGYGNSTLCTLEGLQMSAADQEYFSKRGLTPSFITEGVATPSFNVAAGVSYNPNNWFRLSFQGSSHYVDQSNYHATNVNGDFLFGVNLLGHKYNNALYLEAGAGVSNYYNDYTYLWEGIDPQTKEVIESRTCDLGEHNTIQPSVLAKVYYEHNIFHRSWLGVYAQARKNFASTDFTPEYQASVGLQYRVSFIRAKEKKQTVVYTPQYIETIKEVVKEVHDTVYVHDTLAPAAIPPAYTSIFFKTGSSEITSASEEVLNEFLSYAKEGIVLVLGRCDSTGSTPLNAQLSIDRAREVYTWLIAHGVDADRITYGGSGKELLYNETSVDSRQINRRVDLVVIK